MNRLLLIPLLAFGLSGCFNIYSRIDTAPDGRRPLPFRGIADYLSPPSARLHVIQVHGMGDHSHANDCSRGSENLKLQDAIVERLRYRADAAYTSPEPRDILIDGFTAGTYSVRRFAGRDGQQLYFSCVTWGETSRKIKRKMLELDDQFRETNANEAHRAPLNRAGKRFVNTSFADPMIYTGGLGPYIRAVVWSGITLSIQEHATASLTAPFAQVDSAPLADRSLAFARDIPTAVISDSLGSRLIFDVLCDQGGGNCGKAQETSSGNASSKPAPVARAGASFAPALSASVRSVYMLANQLPLLELSYVPSPSEGTSLPQMLDERDTCHLPLHGIGVSMIERTEPVAADDRVQVVAFTDPNDLLSYHLTERFKARCTSVRMPIAGADDAINRLGPTEGFREVRLPVDVVNVTLPNAKLRWLFVVSNPVKAHSSGFKSNSEAIELLVNGTD